MAGGYGRDIDTTVGVHLATLQSALASQLTWPQPQPA
jgi:hypothetical protein